MARREHQEMNRDHSPSECTAAAAAAAAVVVDNVSCWKICSWSDLPRRDRGRVRECDDSGRGTMVSDFLSGGFAQTLNRHDLQDGHWTMSWTDEDRAVPHRETWPLKVPPAQRTM